MKILIIKNGVCETDIDKILHDIDSDIIVHIKCSQDLQDIDYDMYNKIILLGGAQSLCDMELIYIHHTYLIDLINDLERLIAQGKKILGICLGAQLLAIALGHHIVPIGMCITGYDKDIACNDPELDKISKDLLALHNDMICINESGKPLKIIHTYSCGDHIIPYGFTHNNIYGVQFHPDITPRILSVFCDEFAYDEGLIACAQDRVNDIKCASNIFFFKWLNT